MPLVCQYIRAGCQGRIDGGHEGHGPQGENKINLKIKKKYENKNEWAPPKNSGPKLQTFGFGEEDLWNSGRRLC